MFDYLRNTRWRQVFTASLVYLVVAMFARQVEAMLTMRYYLMPEYFGVWSRVMMPEPGPPPASFMVLSLVFTFVTAVALSILYGLVKNRLPKEFWPRVFVFTQIVVILSLVFFTLPVYLLVNVPLALLASWLVTGVVIAFLGTVGFVRLIK